MIRRLRIEHRGDEGVALLLALVFIVLLAAIVADFTYRIQVDATMVQSSNSNYEALLAAKSGVATALSVLHADRIGNLLDMEEQVTAGMYDSLDEPWAKGGELTSFNDDVVSMEIEDEYSKINLNALIYEANAGGEAVEQVHPVLQMVVSEIFRVDLEYEVDPTDMILDWLDADDTPRPNGAESDYYESLDPPFSCKNGPMDSIEELLLLPGITPEKYFGLPDPDEEPELTDEGEVVAPTPLSDIFTVHGHPEGRLNINTTSSSLVELVLMSSDSLFPGFVSTDITAYENQMSGEFPFFDTENQLVQAGYLPSRVAQQGGQGTGNANDSGVVVNNDDDNDGENPTPENQALMPPPMFTVESNVFRIQSDGMSNQTSVRVEVYAFRDPSDKQGGASEPQLFRILDWRVVQ